MTIDRVGPPDPLSNYNKTQKTSRSRRAGKSDAIEVSDEAKSKAEVYKAAELAKGAPDIRWELVDRAKAKLKDPNYINKEVIETVADRILDGFTGEE